MKGLKAYYYYIIYKKIIFGKSSKVNFPTIPKMEKYEETFKELEATNSSEYRRFSIMEELYPDEKLKFIFIAYSVYRPDFNIRHIHNENYETFKEYYARLENLIHVFKDDVKKICNITGLRKEELYSVMEHLNVILPLLITRKISIETVALLLETFGSVMRFDLKTCGLSQSYINLLMAMNMNTILKRYSAVLFSFEQIKKIKWDFIFFEI